MLKNGSMKQNLLKKRNEAIAKKGAKSLSKEFIEESCDQ